MKKLKNEYLNIVLKMSVPILMNYMIVILFEVLDKAIVGNYSTNDFTAVSVASTVIYGITGSLGVISIAYNIISAKYIGKNDNDNFKNAFFTVMSISLIIGILVIVLSLLFGKLLFSKAFNLEGELLKISLDYLYLSSVTVLLNLILFNFTVYFRNIKNTKISLYSTIASTAINIVFDYLFVYGKLNFPELGAKGSALGSILGLLGGISIYLINIYKNKDFKFNLSINKFIIYEVLSLYFPLLGQDLLEGSIFSLILTAIIARLGIYEISSYTLYESLRNIITLPIYAFSTVAATLAIQKFFSNEDNEANRVINTSITLSILSILILGYLIFVNSDKIIRFITKDELIISNVMNIFILASLMQIANVFNQIYKSYLQGLNNEKFVFKITSIISVISLSWIILLAFKYKLLGIYLGLFINNLIFSIIYYSRIKDIKSSNLVRS